MQNISYYHKLTKFGRTISLSVAQSIFINTLVPRLAKIARNGTINITPANVIHAGFTGFEELKLPPGELDQIREAFAYACANVLLCAMVLLAVGFVTTWVQPLFFLNKATIKNQDEEVENFGGDESQRKEFRM